MRLRNWLFMPLAFLADVILLWLSALGAIVLGGLVLYLPDRDLSEIERL